MDASPTDGGRSGLWGRGRRSGVHHGRDSRRQIGRRYDYVISKGTAITTPIHVDIQAVQRPETANRGIGRYVVAMVESMLASRMPIVGLGLNPALPMPDHLPDTVTSSGLLCWNTRSELRRRASGSAFIHVVSSPFGVADVSTMGVFPPWLRDEGVVTATVVYDLIPFLFSDHYATDDPTRRFLDERRSHVLDSDLLLAISEQTRADLIEHWHVDPATVATIGAPRPHEFDSSNVAQSDRSPAGAYVLAPVGYEWRKDPSMLIEGWSKVSRSQRRTRRLVLVGEVPDDIRDEWLSSARRSRLKRGEVEVLGRVDDDRLRSLYRGADLVVHGSRYEGYGLPVLEASLCGTASITSDRGALPEILDCRQSVFDPDSSDDIAAAIMRALEPGPDRESIVAAAARVAEAPDAFAAGLAAALVDVPSVGVWDPPNSVLLIGGDAALPVSFRGSGRVVTHVVGDQLGRPDLALAASHDHVVHVIDGSADDMTVLRWAAAVPGAVICRRSDLSSLWIDLARSDSTSDHEAVDRLHQVIRRCYRGAHPPALPAGDLLDPHTWSDAGVRGFGALLAANQVLAVEPGDLNDVRFDTGPLFQGSLVAFDELSPTSILDHRD